MAHVRTIAVLFVFWIVLTGPPTAGQAVGGLLLAVFVTAWSAKAWVAEEAPRLTGRRAVALAAYPILLVRDVLLGGVQVAIDVLRPRMSIEPVVIERPLEARRELSRVVLASSISLSPGTLTIDTDEERIAVHCLSPRYARDVNAGTAVQRIARAFEE